MGRKLVGNLIFHAAAWRRLTAGTVLGIVVKSVIPKRDGASRVRAAISLDEFDVLHVIARQ